MEVNAVIKALQEIRVEYPNLTNDEVLKIMELKILMELKSVLSR